MMLKYLVEVRRNAVIVYFEDDLDNVHYRAKIDGCDYAYQIIPARMQFNYPCDDWFKRGGQHVHYHANNKGKHVQWLPVTNDFIHEAMNKSDRSEVEKWDYLKKLQGT